MRPGRTITEGGVVGYLLCIPLGQSIGTSGRSRTAFVGYAAKRRDHVLLIDLVLAHMLVAVGAHVLHLRSGP